MAQLRPFYSRIREAGNEILLVSFYPPDRTKQWARRFDLPFRLATDLTRETYRRWGLGIATLDEVWYDPTVLKAGIKAYLNVGRFPEYIRHWEQLGGYFVVNSAGKVQYSHPCANALDNPDLDELVDAIG